MIISTVVLGLLVVAILIYAYYKHLYRHILPGEPKMLPGHFLWGNSGQFKEDALKMMRDAKSECGNVATVRLLKDHWTVLLDIHSTDAFYNSKVFDFGGVVRAANTNIYRYHLDDPQAVISEASKKINGKELHFALGDFAACFSESLTKIHMKMDTEKGEKGGDKFIDAMIEDHQQVLGKRMSSMTLKWDNIDSGDVAKSYESSRMLNAPQFPMYEEWTETQLKEFVNETLFSPLFYSTFGIASPGTETGAFNAVDFFRDFDEFHDYFYPLFVGIPLQLFPKASRLWKKLMQQPSPSEMIARDRCSPYVKSILEQLEKLGMPDSAAKGHNISLLHVNHNTVRSGFWAIYHLMKHEKGMRALIKEVGEFTKSRNVYEADEGGNCVDITGPELSQLPMLDSYVKELFRWSSGTFNIRFCAKDTTFVTSKGERFNLRKGERFVTFPPFFHNDPEVFDNPSEFQHDRFVDREFFKDGKKIKTPLLGFGAMCPGKNLATNQVKWYLLNMVNNFKFELLDGEYTAINKREYGQEIMPETNDVKIRVCPREGVVQLHYVNVRA